MLNGLDLFSGIGGLTVALSEWCRPIAYCEADKYAQALLLSRMSCGDLPRAPIWDDVQTLSGEQLQNIDIIYGGFPCQDISAAGRGVGLEGERSGLFFEIIRLVKETEAPWVFLENVPAIRTRGLKEVIGTFTDLGYDCRWTCVSAREIGAPHLRSRWFILAHSRSIDAQGLEQQEYTRETYSEATNPFDKYSWEVALDKFPRMDDGLPVPVDEVRALGNAVVPLQAKEAFEKLIGFHV